MSRFDYVKYDSHADHEQSQAKEIVQQLETFIEAIGKFNPKASGRAKALAITKLEECYMWIGKAIRDDQIDRNGATVLNEERRQ